jgi:hypothetical protein
MYRTVMRNTKTQWSIYIRYNKVPKYEYEEGLNIFDFFDTEEEWLNLSEEERDAWLLNKAREITLNEYINIGVY